MALQLEQLLLRYCAGKVDEMVAGNEELVSEVALRIANVVTERVNQGFWTEYDTLKLGPSSLGLLEFVFVGNCPSRQTVFLEVFTRVTDVKFIPAMIRRSLDFPSEFKMGLSTCDGRE